MDVLLTNDDGIHAPGFAALEEEFDITIPFNANEPEKSEFDITNMGSIIAAVEKLVAAKA